MRAIRRFSLLALLAVAAGINGCGPGDSRALRTPTEPSAALGAGAPLALTLVDQPVAAAALTSTASVARVIGAEGGTLSFPGGTITVPGGAVAAPTEFSVSPLPTGHVEVQLLARVTEPSGAVVDVGSRGFSVPVTLTLDYSKATNVKRSSRLTIVYAPGAAGYAQLQVVSSKIDRKRKTVSAQLSHFSRYLLASPD